MAYNDQKDARVAYWQREIERAKKRFKTFWEDGDAVVDAYRLQKSDGTALVNRDKYNILFSSTETIRPNMYAQTPRTMVRLRNRDQASNGARAAALLLEGCVEHVKDEEDFDETMNAAVEDLLLPGLGMGWVRYEGTFEKDAEGKDKKLLSEMVDMEYVYWQDVLFGVSRTWKRMPWVGKRVWMIKEKATKRFGAKKADQLQYATRDSTSRDSENEAETAEIWEIWDKEKREVVWYAESLSELLDIKKDPLRLKNFFPCPKPLRAISNTRTFAPRALYSQYKTQAETLNVLTKRIRLLGEALKVTGVFDASQPKLASLLDANAGNRMIGVDAWALFAQNGGINGSVAWVPIDTISKVLGELLQQREVCKNEIYEITGFSDIVRGVSKASETLGAQNLKANWASARVKKMQKSVQDFARDMLALVGEVIAEHCSDETIAIFSGMQIPTGEQVQSDPAMQQRMATFKEAIGILRNEMRRISSVDIETDSTLMADEAVEREDRAKFLAAAGAFLQQAVPAMEATPELGPLLGALLMFTARSFPSARIVEDEFERVQEGMAKRAAQPQEQDKDGKKAAAQVQSEKLQQEGQFKTQELAQTGQTEQAKLALDTQKEQNRHDEKMAELQLKARETAVEEAKLEIEKERLKLERFKALHEAGMKEEELNADREDAGMEHAADREDADREDTHADADRELEADRLDREDAHREADREAGREEGEADREAAREAQEADHEAQASQGKEGGDEGS